MPAIQIGNLADVPEGGSGRFRVAGATLAVFQVEGTLYALDDTCTHAEASLSAGELDTDEMCVACPLHGAIFDLRTGQPRTLPAFKPVHTYKVWAEGAGIFVDLPSIG